MGFRARQGTSANITSEDASAWRPQGCGLPMGHCGPSENDRVRSGKAKRTGRANRNRGQGGGRSQRGGGHRGGRRSRPRSLGRRRGASEGECSEKDAQGDDKNCQMTKKNTRAHNGDGENGSQAPGCQSHSYLRVDAGFEFDSRSPSDPRGTSNTVPDFHPQDALVSAPLGGLLVDSWGSCTRGGAVGLLLVFFWTSLAWPFPGQSRRYQRIREEPLERENENQRDSRGNEETEKQGKREACCRGRARTMPNGGRWTEPKAVYYQYDTWPTGPNFIPIGSTVAQGKPCPRGSGERRGARTGPALPR